MKKRYKACIVKVIILFFLLSSSAFPDVRISAEGSYTDTHLIVDVYADATDTTVGDADPIVSYGVKMTYDTNDLTAPVVQKNEEDWYFGTPENKLSAPNAAPDTSTPGEIIIIGGKIDETAPDEGVLESKVLLASITFNRVHTNSTPSVSLTLGKGGSYANFVTSLGSVLDNSPRLVFLEPEITPECNLMGDANNDGIVSMSDIYVIQGCWGQQGDDLVGDLNGDGIVSMSDIYVVQENWGSSCP